MNAYKHIEEKLRWFIRKYYINELIKGAILFLSFGLLYLIFTLLVEHFLWLKPTARTVLFWIFILVETSLLVKYIFIPLFKLTGFSEGIGAQEASKIIGSHFEKVDDKLLNMLQLHELSSNSELLLASIEQKAKALRPLPFQKAIRFSSNKKYLKYLSIPLFIWLVILISGKNVVLSNSYDRILHHQQVYVPPAPFSFKITNPDLRVIEGQTLDLQIETQGAYVPEEAKIVCNNEDYFLKSYGGGKFSYRLNNIQKPLTFYLKANKVRSKPYTIQLIPTPKIQGISMKLQYPKYIRKPNEKIENTGTVIVPVGTTITWGIETRQTDSVYLTTNTDRFSFKKEAQTSSLYHLTKNIRQSFHYKIQASNSNLKNYENLSFFIEAIQDDYPEMKIRTDIDSISYGEAQFIGHLSDDYGLSKLQIVYYPQQNPERKKIHFIDIPKVEIANFYYIFPRQLDLQEGVDYEFFFELFDNDAVLGPKSIKSQIYHYHKDNESELKEKILEEQQKELEELKKIAQDHEKNRLDLENLKEELQNKPDIEFNDTKKLEQFIKRQEEYQEMMYRQTDDLERNLEKQPELNNPSLQEKKEDLKQRLQEAKELAKQEKLLEELRKMAEKLQREELLDRIKKMSKNTEQREKSLERLLELTKRFYVEQKAEQLREKLEELAKEQEKLSESKENRAEKQTALNEEFKNFKKDMEKLQKENEQLKAPMPIDSQKAEQQSVEKDMKEATEQLQQNNPQQASKKQQSAAKKMKEMANTLQMQLASMQMNMIEEDIALLRMILENLLNFSFRQENLMHEFKKIDAKHPEFAEKLREQNQLKTFFEHIDDSLYTLSLRQPKLSSDIDKYLANAHYYLDETLAHSADNQQHKAVSDQQHVMTAANDLAYLLSVLLDNLQSSGIGMGAGQGKGGESFGLPDIIEKQGEITEKMKQQMQGKKGEEGKPEKEGKNGTSGDSEQESKELYEIYKQQALLRKALEEQLNDLKETGSKAQADKVKKEMEQLEQMLLEKGITNEVLEQMRQLEYELLKLQNASKEQGEDKKRKAETHRENLPKLSPKQMEFKSKYYPQNEILNREALPLKAKYKKKVKEYFEKK